MTEKVTIATAFYNSEKHLSKYLNCLLNLDFPKGHLNLLWADNDSIDGTKEVLSNFLKKHEHAYNSVRLLDVPKLPQRDGKDVQIANIMNSLFEHAETDIINIDSDSQVPPDSIHKLLFMNEVCKANVCSGITAFIIPKKGKLVPFVNAFMLDSENKCFINVAQHFLKPDGALHLPFMKIEVDSCGFGLCFIEKKVFKQLKCHLESNDKMPFKGEFFPCVDIQFCLEAKSLGFHVMVDTSLYFRHPTLCHEVHIHKDCIVISSSG